MTFARIYVLDETLKTRRPDPSAVRPLAEPDLANQFRPGEVDVLPGRRLIGRGLPKWRGRLRALLEHRIDLAQRVAIEAGADLFRVAKRAVRFVLSEQQGAEMGSRPFRTRVTADYEKFGLRAFDLQPVSASRAAVGRVAQLANDSLEASLRNRVVKVLPAFDYMIAVAHRTFAENQFTQAPLAFFQRHRSGIETIEAEQIEDVIADRNREAQPRYLASVIHMHPPL